MTRTAIHLELHDRPQLPAVGRPPWPGSRYILGSLLALLALNAFAGGYYGLAGAKAIPTEWLEGSPFRDYFVPSLILMVVVGGACLGAAISVFAGRRSGRLAACAAAAVLLGWLGVQVAIIGYVSWMQPATALGGSLILALAAVLPGRRRLP